MTIHPSTPIIRLTEDEQPYNDDLHDLIYGTIWSPFFSLLNCPQFFRPLPPGLDAHSGDDGRLLLHGIEL